MSKKTLRIIWILRIALFALALIALKDYGSIIATILVASLWIEAIIAPNEMIYTRSLSGFEHFFSNLSIAIICTSAMAIYWLFVLII